MARVVCAGHVNWDVTLRVDRLPESDGEAAIHAQHQSGGGSASNTAVVLAGLDVDAHLLGSVGGDEYGWLACRELQQSGVRTHLVESDGQTSVKYLVVEDDGEVMVLGTVGGNEAYAAADLPGDALDDAGFLHLTNQDPESAAALASRATDASVPVSFDPGRRLADRDYADTIAKTDVLFLNDKERDHCEKLDSVPIVVEKRGSDGAVVHTRDETVTGETAEVEAAKAETVDHPGFLVEPVDTTGAGDAFDAGFLAARLRGEDLAHSLAVANACGALAARTRGARLHVGWQDVDAVLDVGPV